MISIQEIASIENKILDMIRQYRASEGIPHIMAGNTLLNAYNIYKRLIKNTNTIYTPNLNAITDYMENTFYSDWRGKR